MAPEKNKAVIWDMDGVIVDSAQYHYEAWRYVFKKRGVDFTGEHFRRHFGQRNDTIIRSALGDNVSQAEIDAIAFEKEEEYRRRVKGNIRALPGAIELIKSLDEGGFCMAVASSAPPENIQMILRELGIGGYFQAVVYGREVKHGKPNPEAYLLAARKLGIEPAGCMVIEDAVAGVTGAKRAGMCCIGVTTTHPREKLSEADIVVDTLESVDASTLEKTMASAERLKGAKMAKIEKSLVLIKPDAMERNLGGKIIARFQEIGFKVVALRMLHMDKALAGQHYAVHKEKPFFNNLVEYITSAPIIAMVLKGENAIEVIRNAMGSTDPAKAKKETIRGDFGLSIEHNSVHGSDSPENAEKEISLFFGKGEIFE